MVIPFYPPFSGTVRQFQGLQGVSTLILFVIFRGWNLRLNDVLGWEWLKKEKNYKNCEKCVFLLDPYWPYCIDWPQKCRVYREPIMQQASTRRVCIHKKKDVTTRTTRTTRAVRGQHSCTKPQSRSCVRRCHDENAWHAIAPLTYLAPKQDWGSAEQHKAWVVVWAMHMVTVDTEGSRGARLKLWFSKFYSCPWEIFRSSAPRPSSHCPSSHMIQPQAMATVGQMYTQKCTVCLKSMKITSPSEVPNWFSMILTPSDMGLLQTFKPCNPKIPLLILIFPIDVAVSWRLRHFETNSHTITSRQYEKKSVRTSGFGIWSLHLWGLWRVLFLGGSIIYSEKEKQRW